MKNTFKILILSSILFVSCDKDLLEPFTPGALTEDVAIVASSDLQRLMNSTYNILTNRAPAEFSSVFTDECGIGFANGGQGLADNYAFFVNPGSASPNNIWSMYYYTLSRANRVIKFADEIAPASPADAELLQRLKAEALSVRAYCHIQLTAYFSTNPKDNSALGVVLANRIITTAESPVRVSNGDVYGSIHADLDAASAIFTSLPAPTYANPALYANNNFAKAMKARAYALKGDYVNAEIWADDVIATSGISLATFANYRNVFHGDNQPNTTEVIFKLKRTLQQSSQATNMGNAWASVNTTLSGSPFFEIGRSLFNIIPTTDIRYQAIVHPTSVIDPGYATSPDFLNTDKLVLAKHPGYGAVGNLNNDHKISRISEMYLIKAEARANANDLTGAATAIQTLLNARFNSAQALPVYATATDAWKAILTQRRIEFAFEGYRYIDLKRIGSLANEEITRDPADCAINGACSLPLNSYKFTLPIPTVETNANTAIQQNPGY